MDDADLELAVKAIVDSRVINSGQVCNCAERVYVQKAFMISLSIGWVKRCKRFNLVTPLNATTLRWGR